MRNYIITTKGEIKPAEPNEGKISFDQLRRALPASEWFQMVQIPEGELWVDEEGKLKHYVPNKLATFLMCKKRNTIYDVIVGDVILRLKSNYDLETVINEAEEWGKEQKKKVQAEYGI